MISEETQRHVADKLLLIEWQIENMERDIPHDRLPAEYDTLIEARDSARRLLRLEPQP